MIGVTSTTSFCGDFIPKKQVTNFLPLYYVVLKNHVDGMHACAKEALQRASTITAAAVYTNNILNYFDIGNTSTVVPNRQRP